MFCWLQNFTRLHRWWVDKDWISIFRWTSPLSLGDSININALHCTLYYTSDVKLPCYWMHIHYLTHAPVTLAYIIYLDMILYVRLHHRFCSHLIIGCRRQPIFAHLTPFCIAVHITFKAWIAHFKIVTIGCKTLSLYTCILGSQHVLIGPVL